ncbi:MAG TPA: aminotransferase class I/II-fold pyridoxal phosphate-dependent enzyme [Candidatus Goldiibacteriota bacterium]|nr:aminotransferase class I/II-fold pyridoxal phosphate-dependent enzyme [Candidatus Goldiibacteriota bacterium]
MEIKLEGDLLKMLASLENEKLRALPPYILGVVKKELARLRKEGKDIIDFSMGNPDGATPQHIVDKLVEAARNPRNHRYSASRGIYKLNLAIADFYKRRFNVDLDPNTECITTIGSKEGISHLMYAVINRGDSVLVPTPCYPIHSYAVSLAGGNVISVPIVHGRDFFQDMVQAVQNMWPKPKFLLLNYPHNPTTEVVDITFFEKVVDFAVKNNIIVLHDNAYSELYFDDYIPSSFLQVPGAKEIGAEFYTLSKTYNMPGWRVGFLVGNRNIVRALERIKSYLDYGMFQPIQIAAIHALNSSDDCVKDIRAIYKTRRDVLCEGLNKIGWPVEKPKATMFVWAEIPARYKAMGSLEFAIKLLNEAETAVTPGLGFGEGGEGFVRFALIENEQRTKQALKNIKRMFEK